MYKVNYNLLFKQITLTPLRLPKFYALTRVLCGHIVVLYKDFLKVRKHALYEAAHGSQVIYLEKYLNDRFCKNGGSIKIVDGQELTKPKNVFYTAAENVEENPVFYTSTEGGGIVFNLQNEYANSPDFVVQINNTEGNCNPDMAELHAVIQLRKLPGITYEIETIIN